MTEDRAALRVDGRTFTGWLNLEIARSLEQAAASFAFGATSRYPGEINPVRIRPSAACEVLIGAEVIATGYVDAVAPKIDASSYEISITGRSKTADLIDCSAVHKPGRWHNRKAEKIAAELARPFGVEVRAAVDTGPALPRFALEHGETVFEAIEKLARARALLVTDDGAGRLVLTRAGQVRAQVALELGANILGGESKADASGVFGLYIVKGQRAGGDDDFGEAVAQVYGEATDPRVSRYRVLTINADGHTSRATAKARAQWEAATRLGKSLEGSVTVQGWRQVPGGRLWAPNELVQVKAEALGLSGEFLIAGVVLTLDEGGHRAKLDLALPEAYRPEPIKIKGGGSSGMWKEIAKGVQPAQKGTP